MGEETCRNCRSWEEETYWTHFQYTRFSQTVHAGFEQLLSIPQKFSTNLKKKLPETLMLKGPSGNTWEVGLMMIDNTMFFHHGWENFVKDHCLQEKDLLIFKYNGVSHFDVLIFDGLSMCEKAATYFVRKCEHKERDIGCQTKRKLVENSAEEILASPHDAAQGTPPEPFANNEIDTAPLEEPIVSPSTCKRNRIEHVHTRQSKGNEELPSSDEEIETKPVVEHASTGRNVGFSAPYISCKRLVTRKEKSEALRLAAAAVSDKGFLVVMRPTHVSRKFFMSIPSAWLLEHFNTREKQDVYLRTGNKTWTTKFTYQKSKNSGGLSCGWKTFVQENNLDEFDVCVFEPGHPINDSIVLHVTFFYAVQE